LRQYKADRHAARSAGHLGATRHRRPMMSCRVD
jgi:hypothetical protein